MIPIIASILIYIIGMYAYIDAKTIKNIKFHERGYSTITHRDIIPKDVRMSLLWPILFGFWIIKILIRMLNDLCSIVLIGFGYRNYKKSKVYNFISEKFA
jgi:hypothetical protein